MGTLDQSWVVAWRLQDGLSNTIGEVQHIGLNASRSRNNQLILSCGFGWPRLSCDEHAISIRALKARANERHRRVREGWLLIDGEKYIGGVGHDGIYRI